MGTVTTTSIIGRASVLLNDTENTHWPTSELLGWINDGQREIVLYRPNACVRNVNLILTAGTKQTIPLDGNTLVDVTRNTNGNSIRPTSRQVLDAVLPDWHLPTKAKTRVEHYCYSDADPKTFYVFPPSPGGNSVEIIYNANPAQVALGGAISVDDIYAGPLVDYIVFRAFSKDTDYAPNGPSATAHYQAFLAAIKGQETKAPPRA